MPKVIFTKLHPGQASINSKMGERNVLRCGRRFGKTKLLETRFARLAIGSALGGKAVGWFAPTYKLVRPTYENMLRTLYPITTRHSKTESLIQLKTGGSIEFWTLDDEDAGRSRSYDEVVIDEASLKETGLRDIVEQAINPTLLDRNGNMTMAGTPKGVDPENYFYAACTDRSLGFAEFHGTTYNNPTLSPDSLARLKDQYPPLVYQQEILAEFVDWAGVSFFSESSLLEDGAAPEPGQVDVVFATIDTATKTGRGHDGTAVIFWGYRKYPTRKLYVLDWEVLQIEGALLETWLPTIFSRLDGFCESLPAAMGSVGAFIEDKASGMVLLQQGARRGWPVTPIDGKLTSLGKEERAISISGYVYQGLVKFSKTAFEKTMNYKGVTANHLRKQVVGFRIGADRAKAEDDGLDAFCYGVSICLGDDAGF
jgi:hypothetical protein